LLNVSGNSSLNTFRFLRGEIGTSAKFNTRFHGAIILMQQNGHICLEFG
jgi:hypothetical protein